MTQNRLSPEDLQTLNLQGRAFLHEQGMSLCRGFIVDLNCNPEAWEMTVRDVDYFDPLTSSWSRECATDTYSASFFNEWSAEYDPETHLITLPGYGMQTHVAPLTDSPWTEIIWPEMDNFSGGRL